MKRNLGGERLGSGNKMTVEFHGYNRSNHDLGFLWKSTMAAGTLVPFMSVPALPGDTHDIDLNSIVKTMPTIGPLFGSFKLQLDVFSCPIRLYNAMLHNNKLNVGTKISAIKLPIIGLTGPAINTESEVPAEFQQINQSSIFAYLGIRGLLRENLVEPEYRIERYFNAIPYLAYWDIFKNYYANKMEENAYVIHGVYPVIHSIWTNNAPVQGDFALTATSDLEFRGDNLTIDNIEVEIGSRFYKLDEVFKEVKMPYKSRRDGSIIYPEGTRIVARYPLESRIGSTYYSSRIAGDTNLSELKPTLESFPLANIDLMRENILKAPTNTAFTLDSGGYVPPSPYNLPLSLIPNMDMGQMYALMGQEGLAVKTYQSDIFNNWVDTELVDGENGINAITSISTVGDKFSLDSLNIAQKVYNLLNHIAAAGNTYSDYIEATYDHRSRWRAESPVYCGGLSKEIVFQEIVSTAATEGDPLGSLAGKGVMADKHKGGHIIINVDEPSYIIGIVSITPRVCYSQGNAWDVSNLFTLDDFHKPALDGIGYQDLITDQMSFCDTAKNANSLLFKSAGKQPAWLNYQTSFDKSYGNFADSRSQKFMTLDRSYTIGANGIEDLTTYIDPSKFNYAFAQTDLSAQNFWVQIGVNHMARRKMSAKQIPNL